MTEFDELMNIKNKMTIEEEVAEIINHSPEQLQQVTVIVEPSVDTMEETSGGHTGKQQDNHDGREIQENIEELSGHLLTE